MDEAPRILVEGGPVHRRVEHLMALVVALAIVIIGASVGLTFVALSAHRAGEKAETAIMRIRRSRVQSIELTCDESNDRHLKAKKGLESLAAQGGEGSQRLKQKAQMEIFLESIAPRYDCKKRVQELTAQRKP